MYGSILRQLRESKGRLQAEVARSVGISPAQLARLESNQRGLYVEDFVRIAEALGEKPGNLLSNDVGDIGHLKPLIDRLAGLRPEFLPRVSTIIEKLVLLTEDVTAVTRLPERKLADQPRRKSMSASRKGRR
jgi:transcriptional regulator with XRE-family HTH domain